MRYSNAILRIFLTGYIGFALMSVAFASGHSGKCTDDELQNGCSNGSMNSFEWCFCRPSS